MPILVLTGVDLVSNLSSISKNKSSFLFYKQKIKKKIANFMIYNLDLIKKRGGNVCVHVNAFLLLHQLRKRTIANKEIPSYMYDSLIHQYYVMADVNLAVLSLRSAGINWESSPLEPPYTNCTSIE